MPKCSNINCPIVKEYGQICTTLVSPKHMNNINKVIMICYEPQKSETGHWYCGQFGD